MKSLDAVSLQGLPTLPTGTEVASYRTYAEAQAAVDHLSDESYDVRELTIVGTDLQLVERITGRLTWGKVLWNGFLSGLWLGLFVAILFALWTPNGLWAIMLVGLGMGGIFGVILAAVPYAFRGGERDFTSATQVVASRYAVLARQGAEQFREVLRNTPGNLTSLAQRPVAYLSKSTPFGSNPHEQPRYGVRLTPEQREAQKASQQEPYGEVSAPGVQPDAPSAPAPQQDEAASAPDGQAPRSEDASGAEGESK